jgi:hypothetical protein
MGRLIPAGTGLEFYRNFRLLTEVEAPQPEVAVETEAVEAGIAPATPAVTADLVDEDEARTP